MTKILFVLFQDAHSNLNSWKNTKIDFLKKLKHLKMCICIKISYIMYIIMISIIHIEKNLIMILILICPI